MAQDWYPPADDPQDGEEILDDELEENEDGRACLGCDRFLQAWEREVCGDCRSEQQQERSDDERTSE